ncbi:hypothetical protein PENSPDRAFT_656701 [Peniophora sp. CONT]|nr:hypothetical protein PENSPDRAFT_656701 [Peniophora sp. CONT]
MLQELFPPWSRVNDLVSVHLEVHGDVELAALRISEYYPPAVLVMIKAKLAMRAWLEFYHG